MTLRTLSTALVLGVVILTSSWTQSQENLGKPKAVDKLPSPPQIAQFKDFSDWVTSVAISPDGAIIAAGSYQKVQLIDLATKKTIGTLDSGKGFAKGVAFSPDGTSLAVGGYRTLTLWNVKTQKPVKTLEGHRDYVTSVSFSHDGKLLVSGSDDESVRIWSLPDGQPGPVLSGHLYPVQGVAISPDGALIASAAGDEDRPTKPGEVKLWTMDGKELAALPDHKRGATGVAFSPDGKYLASTGLDEAVNIYRVEDKKALGFFGGHGRPTNAVVFAKDGKTVISAAGGRAKGNNTAMFWLREDGEEKASIETHQARVSCLALSVDGKTLVTGSYDKSVAVWNVSAFSGASETDSPAGPAEAEIPAVASVTRGDMGDPAAAAKQPAANSTTKPAEVPDPKKADETPAKPLRELKAGIIGLDTSHVVAFTNSLNDPKKKSDLAGCRIVAAYPKGSPDIKSSTERVPKYIEEVKKQGVEIVDSIPALLEKVDVVFLETNDGRPHLEQILPVLKAKKPVFIDKPVAGSLADAVAIYELAAKYGTPVFSSSSLRYTEGAQALRNGSAGDILGCEAFSPCSLEATHPDLFWYGIHGVETLFTVMGTGCQSVTRVSAPDVDYVTGTWAGGRVGTFRGIRKGAGGYGGTAYGTKSVTPIGSFGKDGPYRPMLVEILKFFQTGVSPVDPKETLEIYAFMEAADESKRQEGKPVTLQSVLEKARQDSVQRIEDVTAKN